MHSVCRCSLPVWRRSFLNKETHCNQFFPRPGSVPGRIWPKNNSTCKGPWVLHPYQVSSKSTQQFWRRSRKCEKVYGRRRRTDDERCDMTMAHLSLRLRWAKKLNAFDAVSTTQRSSTGLQVFCLALLQPCTDHSLSIALWLTRRFRLYDGPFLNLLRGDRVLIPVPSDC